MKPFFLVIEGIDGSGKSTLSRSLFSELSRNMECSLFSEPTQFETGLKIRRHLKGEISLSRSELISEFLEDRKLSIERNILPALSLGKNVILDRYFYSMAAYQSDSSISASEILKMNLERGFIEPDAVFYLNISPEKSLQRIEQRGGVREIFESLEQLKKIHSGFLEVLPSKTVFLDAEAPMNELLETALDKIRYSMNQSKDS